GRRSGVRNMGRVQPACRWHSKGPRSLTIHAVFFTSPLLPSQDFDFRRRWRTPPLVPEHTTPAPVITGNSMSTRRQLRTDPTFSGELVRKSAVKRVMPPSE